MNDDEDGVAAAADAVDADNATVAWLGWMDLPAGVNGTCAIGMDDLSVISEAISLPCCISGAGGVDVFGG
jgi:hypothetical protein